MFDDDFNRVVIQSTFTFHRVPKGVWDGGERVSGSALGTVGALLTSEMRKMCLCNVGLITCPLHDDDYKPEGHYYLVMTPNDVMHSVYRGESVWEANYRVLADLFNDGCPNLKKVTYSDSETFASRVDENFPAELCDILSGLIEYPVIDENVLAQVELEWSDESMRGYYVGRLKSDLEEFYDIDTDEAFTDDELIELIYKAQDATSAILELSGDELVISIDGWDRIVLAVAHHIDGREPFTD